MKITKYILSLAAAIGMIAGCQKAELVQMLPADQAVAPVLSDLPDTIKITPLNMAVDSVVFNWTSADFGVSTQVTYAIEVAEKGGATKAIVSSGITDTTAVLYYETINVALFEGLELLDAVATDVEFYVSAYTGESAKIYSAGVPVNATATAAERDYPKMTVVGDYQGWAPGKGQYVFDFAGTDETYSGIIGFGINDYDMTKNEFKITGTDWGADNGEHSVPEGTEVAAEADKIPLTKGGGSNIAAYKTKKFYHLTFDKKTPQLIKNFAFDQVGVIGVNGDWDNDVVMNFNAAKQRFYADVEFTADGNFKFRADAGWDLNWGVKDGVVEAGGDNIEAKAGKYRVYLNLNNPDNITYELNAKAYGIEEGTTPAPEPEPEPEAPALKGWGICGGPTGWADGADIMLASDGTWHFVKGVELEGELKFRLDGSWGYEGEDGNYVDQNWGLPKDDANAAFAAGVELTLAKGGNNIAVTKGTYDVYLNPETGKAWFITDGSYPGGAEAPEQSPWSLIGDFNSWSADHPMFIEGGYHVAKGFVVANDGGLKFRKDGNWNPKDENGNTLKDKDGNDIQSNFGVKVFAPNAELEMTPGGDNIPVKAGTYDVYLKVAEDELSAKAYFMTDGQTPEGAGAAPEVPEVPEASGQWYLAGNYKGGSANPADGLMTKEGEYFVLKGVAADGQWMVFTDGTWDNKLSGSFVSADSPMEVVKVTGQESFTPAVGTYDVYLQVAADATSGTAYFMTQGKTPSDATVTYVDPTTFEVGLSGSMNNWGDVYVAAFDTKNITDATKYAGTYTFKLTDLTLDGNDEFKIRIKGDWVGVGKATVEGIEVAGTDNFTTTSTGSYNLAISFDWDGQKYSNVKAVFTAK